MEPENDYLEFNPELFNKEVQIDGGFSQLIEEIKRTDIHLPDLPVIVTGMADIDLNLDRAYVLTCLEPDNHYPLNIKRGCTIAHQKNTPIIAYDESIAYYSTLEGKIAYVSHSLVYMYNGQYYPLNRLSALFCTKSEIVHNKIPGSIIANKWDIDTTINVEIAKQKGKFIQDNCYKNSILLIDGPIIAGDGMAYFYPTLKNLIEDNIIPVFIVKNSYSSLLADSVPELKSKYNSDLHYANELLSEGSRTSFYRYQNGDKTKVFCYLKHKDHHSPLRIEFPSQLFEEKREVIELVMDLVYYLIMVQGDMKNPQVRPIAIAEKYARETLKLVNFKRDLMQKQLTPTMNEERGMLS